MIDHQAFPWTGARDAEQTGFLQQTAQRHARRRLETSQAEAARLNEAGAALMRRLRGAPPAALAAQWRDYAVDAAHRAALTLDALRQRGDVFIEHEAAGAPPVLDYAYEVAIDGADLPRPCNYMLLRITPPDGVEVFAWKRPYVIIDPRAGHGPGIGGFKPDSQVGVALRDGHPVYFVAFRPHPAPGQKLADVTHAEAHFLREVARAHPEAPKPVVVGNCQGGWATAILAARNPDLAGPIVLNGAPMSYWSGRVGQDPMRYAGGAGLGVTPALVAADLGGGLFDGADLVMNFEMLNPGRTWFRKYYDLFADPSERAIAHFLEFERWWGGFYLMTEAEIRWIVENLFVGDRLGKNEARLEVGRPIDLKAIAAPIIVFASHGDNITPPQQALNWILDTYADEREIEIHGQRIIYMVHEKVGHLGIFVSSSVAKKEHSEVASVMKTIEALAPGLYEMTIDETIGEGRDMRFKVSFYRRSFGDVAHLDDGRGEEAAFAAVARLSETLAETYDATLRPAVQALGRSAGPEMRRKLHPLRMQRWAVSSQNPALASTPALAGQARSQRNPVAQDNPFLMAERLWADAVEAGWNMLRDMRAFSMEATFYAAYATPWMLWYGRSRAERRARRAPGELRALPQVRGALAKLEEGGLAEAVVRMLVLLAGTRNDVRRDRLERSNQVLTTRRPFAAMAPAARAAMIHQQSLIAHFEPEAAIASLPHLLAEPAERREAIGLVEHIVGAPEEMEPRTKHLLQQIRGLLATPALESGAESGGVATGAPTPEARTLGRPAKRTEEPRPDQRRPAKRRAGGRSAAAEAPGA
ncbi:MAG: DUF3141 domain-containing protein [Pseudomonadota bacterium]